MFPLRNVSSLLRGNLVISHLLFLITSRPWRVHWHLEHLIESTLDCEDCKLIQSNFAKVARV